MDRDFVAGYLREMNYWWEGKPLGSKETGIARPDYTKRVREALEYERIVCLSGIRRAGKTTLMFQVINGLLPETDCKKIVYARLDDLIGKIDDVRDIVGLYHELTGVDARREKVFFFFDEIHVMSGWQRQLKHFIDAHYPAKFVVSGSSRTLLYKDASESLAGRITFVNVFPLTFREFLEFKGVKLPFEKQCLAEASFAKIRAAYDAVAGEKSAVAHAFSEYLAAGGFPEWFKVRDLREWRRMLVEDYFSLMLFKDIVSVYKVKDPLLLERLVKEIARMSTNRFSYLSLSNRFDVDRETLKLYVYYLKSSAMVSVADVYSKNRKASERREKKLFFCEEGLRKALTLDEDPGRAVENAAAAHFIVEGTRHDAFFEPSYWKNDLEVDFVYDDGRTLLPVEVKYQRSINAADLKGIIDFAKKFGAKKAFVASRDVLEKRSVSGTQVIIAPAWLLLALV
ncbi:MAG: ATP-binding protein [Candidatus Micrarchaeota archaeon]